LFTPDFIIAML